MRTSALARSVLALTAALVTGAAAAEETADDSRIEELEQRIEELEAAVDGGTQSTSGFDWSRYVRIGGSADAGWFGGEQNSGFDHDSFEIWDARFFVDAFLGDRVELFDTTVFRNIGFFFEWDLVRIGDLENRVGELYVDFQGIAGRDDLNVQVGRFQLPVGESYLLYSRGYAKRYFVSNPVGGPWWWDEGLRFYGSFQRGGMGYVASVTDGDTPFNTDATTDKLVSLKLYGRPTSWLYLSASALRTGKLGNSGSPASGALWLGESWARAFGSRSDVDNYYDGGTVPDGPNRIDESWFVGADAIVELDDKLRVWLAGGRYDIDSSGPGRYDRTLYYWIAEGILRGAWLSPSLRPFYLGARANTLSTYDSGEGYLLDKRRSGTLGYNMKSLAEYSAVLGWDINKHVRVRAEYAVRDIDMVRGVTPAMRDDAHNANYYAIEVGGSF